MTNMQKEKKNQEGGKYFFIALCLACKSTASPQQTDSTEQKYEYSYRWPWPHTGDKETWSRNSQSISLVYISRIYPVI